MRRRYGYYWTKLALIPVAFIVSIGVFIWIGDSWWQMFTAVWFAFLFTQTAFLGHDAAHRQIFRSGKWNDWVSLILGGFVGMSYGWWQHKHTRHHANPNQLGIDPDIDLPVVAFTPEQATRHRSPLMRWVMAHQGAFFFPILLLEGLSLHASSVHRVFMKEHLAHRPAEIAFLAVRIIGFLALVFFVLSPDKAAVFLAIQLGLFGLYMGASFAPNHKGMPLVPKEVRLDFLRRQVLMSRNISGTPVPRLHDGRAQLPDRAPPLPVDAPAAPAPRGADHRRVLPGTRRDLHGDHPVAVVRDRAALHQPGRARRAGPVRVPARRQRASI